MLLIHGANINSIGRWDYKPIDKVNRTDVLRVLLTYKPDLSNYVLLNESFTDIINAYKENPQSDIYNPIKLHEIIRSGDIVKTSQYIKYGADYRFVSDNGRTALHCASEKGCIEIVTLLLDLNKSENRIIYYSSSTLVDPQTGQQERYKSEKQRYDDVAINSFINYQDKAGLTALMVASQQGHQPIVNVLKEYGAKE